MRVLCVSMVSAKKSLENDQRKTQNEMERDERSGLEERCTNYIKEKSNRKTNMDLMFLRLSPQ